MYIFNKSNIAYGRKISGAFNYLINMMNQIEYRQDIFQKRLDKIQSESNSIEISFPRNESSAVPVDYLKRFTENIQLQCSLNGIDDRNLICIRQPNNRLRYAIFNLPITSGFAYYNPLELDGNTVNTIYTFNNQEVPVGFVYLFDIIRINEDFCAIDLSDKTYSTVDFGNVILTKIDTPTGDGIYLFSGQNALTISKDGKQFVKIVSPNTYNYSSIPLSNSELLTGTYSNIFRYEEEI